VDLFSLGCLAEKISTAGLKAQPGSAELRLAEDVRALVKRLKAFDSIPATVSLPHDELVAEIDRLLVATAGVTTTGTSRPVEFVVAGEWTAQEMAQGRGAGRRTPLTPVALPLPTPVSAPLAPAPDPYRTYRPGRLSRIGVPLLFVLAPVIAGGGVFLKLGGTDDVSRSLSTLIAGVEKTFTQALQPPAGSSVAAAPDPEQASNDAPGKTAIAWRRGCAATRKRSFRRRRRISPGSWRATSRLRWRQPSPSRRNTATRCRQRTRARQDRGHSRG
jgi:hypothetical protein